MRATNSLVPGGNQPKSFTAYTSDTKVRNALVTRVGGDEHLAARLIATLNSVVADNEKLQQCDYASIMTAALQGEIANDLSLAMGEYGIIPYGGKAKYQLQVNGLKQLCIRSGAYEDIGCFDVREGEYKGRDPKTRRPMFAWIEDDDVRNAKPIVGYYAFYLLNEKYSHFFQSIYWTHDKILRHADRYSPGFELSKYEALLSGQLSPKDVLKLQGGVDEDGKVKKGSSPWYANPDDMAHMKMCQKTVLKQLLNDGFAPKSVRAAIQADNSSEYGNGNGVVNPDMIFPGDNGEVVVMETTGEVVDSQETAQEPLQGPSFASDVNLPTENPKKAPGRSKKAESIAQDAPHESMDDFNAAFFGGNAQ